MAQHSRRAAQLLKHSQRFGTPSKRAHEHTVPAIVDGIIETAHCGQATGEAAEPGEREAGWFAGLEASEPWDEVDEAEPLTAEDLAEVSEALAGDIASSEVSEYERIEREHYRGQRELEGREQDTRALEAALAETEREVERVRKRLAEVAPEPEEQPLRMWAVDPTRLSEAHHARLSARPEGALLLWAVTNARLKKGYAQAARRELLQWLGTPGADFPLTEGQVRKLQRLHDSLARQKQARDARKAGQPKSGGEAFGDGWARTVNDAAG